MATTTEGPTFRPWHFFLLVGMAAATVAVQQASSTDAGHLVFMSLAIVSAGYAGLMILRTIGPLVSDEAGEARTSRGERTRAALEREKALVLRSIKELEFDRAMGKVADADFNDMVSRLRARAIGLMQQLDERPADYRAAIEREVAARRGRGAEPRPAGGPDERVAARLCGACDTRNEADARFCKQCGAPLATA